MVSWQTDKGLDLKLSSPNCTQFFQKYCTCLYVLVGSFMSKWLRLKKIYSKLNCTFYIVRLTISHCLFLEFWLVHTWFFAHWRHQSTVTCLENVRQLNKRWGKKLGLPLSLSQPSYMLMFIMTSQLPKMMEQFKI